MRIGYDAKRLFCNHRGLGNYSRDLIRILNQYYPENQYDLYTPKIKIEFPINPQNTQIIQPRGIYKFMPSSIWRSIGIKSDIKRLGDDIFHESIIAISEQSKQDAIEFFNADAAKVTVVYQGCNNIFRQKATTGEKEQVKSRYNLPTDYILFVGAIEPRKNIASILQAISQEKINIPLVIVGRQTDYAAELLKLAERLNIQSQVLFLHQVETTDLPAIYQLAQLLIYPSVFEGFGIPILEALCSETPVITSIGSCFEETGGKNSLYIHPHNTEEIGATLLKVLSDSSLRETMKKEGLIYSEKFTDDKIALNLMSVYQNIL